MKHDFDKILRLVQAVQVHLFFKRECLQLVTKN